MAGVTRNWRRQAPQDEHEIDQKDLYYLPDGVYRAVSRAPVFIDQQIQDGKRTVTVSKRVATSVKVVKISGKVQDSGGRPWVPHQTSRKERR